MGFLIYYLFSIDLYDLLYIMNHISYLHSVFSTVCTEHPGSYPNLSGGCRAGVRCGDFPEFPDFPGARGARGVRGA